MNKSKKPIYILIFALVFIEVFTIFLMYKSSNNQGDLFKNVYTLENSPKDMFAILVEQEDGTYKKSDNTSWKDISSIYMYNSTLSGCVDKNGNKLNGILTFQNGVATVETKTTTLCYLYFSKDKEAPSISNFYLADGDNLELQYTNVGLLDAIIEWKDSDVDSYCITAALNSSSCVWEKTSDTTVHARYTLPKANADNKIYAYLKDKAGNISNSAMDSVIFDTTPPKINDVVRTKITKNSITISVNATDELSGIKEYYYKFDGSGYVSSTTSTYTFTNMTDVAGAHTISVYAVDKTNQTSEVKTITLSEMNFGQFLMAIQTPGFNSTLQGGMYRYQGTINDVANYVCFGTESLSACKANPELYMYMIIGVVGTGDAQMGTEESMVKLIKKEALNDTYKWSEFGYESFWNPDRNLTATLLNGINGSYYLTNTGTYSYFNNSVWLNKIADLYWKYVDGLNENGEFVYSAMIRYNPYTMYEAELKYSTAFQTTKKIGLMYLHDYYYSSGIENIDCFQTNDHGECNSKCQNSWLFLNNRDPNPPSGAEWTMQRNGYAGCEYGECTYAYLIRANLHPGCVNGNHYVSNNYSASPVFYLTTNVEYVDGSGTITDPFIIS